jgi:hypothetical protein
MRKNIEDDRLYSTLYNMSHRKEIQDFCRHNYHEKKYLRTLLIKELPFYSVYNRRFLKEIQKI